MEQWLAEGLEAGGIGSCRPLETEGERSQKGGSGRALVETHDRFPGMAGGRVANAKRGQCEPIVAAGGGQARKGASRPHEVRGRGDEGKGRSVKLSRFAHRPRFRDSLGSEWACPDFNRLF